MVRLSIVIVILAAAFIGLLTFVLRGDGESRGMQEKLLSGDERSVAKGDRKPILEPLPKDRPSSPKHQLLSLSYFEGDARRNRGGGQLVSVRGNLVVFRRNIGAVSFERTVVRRGLMESTLSEWSTPAPDDENARLLLEWDLGARKGSRRVSEETGQALLAVLKGTTDGGWHADGLQVVTAIEADAAQESEVPEWPTTGLPPPETFLEGAEAKPIGLARAALLDILNAGSAKRGNDLVRIVRFEWQLP
ncbi:MAG TPA: hypothetical protein PKA37_00250 [Planctomycetota bacterium]|nr:hypothetical protein [Planctomycetota bacterium]